MISIAVQNFAEWRQQARHLLLDAVEPQAVHWRSDTQTTLFGEPLTTPGVQAVGVLRVPAEFFALAERAACFRSAETWALLYRIAWRLVFENRQLLKLAADDDIQRLHRYHRAVTRDMHKMKAFVRFRRVDAPAPPAPEPGDWPEQFVAWYEPKHQIVEQLAPFFAGRFTAMHWSLLTPDLCLHWNTQQLQISPGIDKPPLAADALEEYWRRYYLSIFNPARTNTQAMRAQLPVYYWKNLPEAADIAPMVQAAPQRVASMLEAPGSEPDSLRNKSKRLRESQDRLRQTDSR